jgi:hypothetical protein
MEKKMKKLSERRELTEPADIMGKYRGRVVHAMCAHDENCPAWGTGVGCIAP